MSAYEGYLSLGGNEIVNNARVRGYAETAQCPMWWLRGPYCASMADALGDEVYSAQTMNDAPWYDTDTPDRSRRFFGAFATSITGVYDSTRSASVVEGVDDGGRVGRVRKRARQVKVKALLMAQGRDALEYGMAWMNAALDPGACGQHGDTCGSTDLEFFVDCPPARGTVQEWTAWADSTRNKVANGSMERVVGANREVRRNLIQRTDLSSAAGWTATAGTVTSEGGRLKFTSNGNSVARLGVNTQTVAAKPAGDYVASFRAQTADPLLTGVRVLLYDSVTATIRATGTTPVIAGGADNKYEFSLVASGAFNTVYMEFYGTAIGTGNIGYLSQPLLEAGTRQRPWFNGATSPNTDLIPTWAGTAGASESILSGLSVAVTSVAVSGCQLYQSGQWAKSGAKSVVVDPNGTVNASYGSMPISGLTPGQTYTAVATVRLAAAQTGSLNATWQRQIMAQSPGMVVNNVVSNRAPNAAGETEVRVTFTLAASDTVTIFFMNGSTSTPVWFDDLAIVQGVYDGAFFNGNTVGDDTVRYIWAGAENASDSIRQTRQQFERPQTDAEYAPFVDEARRYLHNVVAVSGPLITAEYEVNGFHAYEVEIVFVAERPWVYSVTRPVELPTTASTVVEDIAHNLTPFPSAERPGEEVLTALNLSTNPSAETNLTGWTSIASIVSGADPAPYLAAMDRSGEKFAAGIWSVRRRLLGTATVANGRAGVLLSQIVALGARPANTRYSVNIWGALTNQGGSGTVLRELRAYIIWSGGAGRTDQIAATTDPAVMAEGLPFIAKSILPPAGATQANIVVRGEFDWASGPSPSDVRIYADALALTIP
ncbi:minor tail protein [Microbacterium phage Matzah]|uniref:Minor tail protein n=1 Tax=Microbacterium phage Matzah TaxID=2686228 RepID=A0A6B9L6E4_9CAUD|nr:minor tail protein [Microbacterium phage Matzah]QHB37026.1 minor tail protein [Microbacterium phage Matzah]